jgi:hypothetical protein
MKLIILFAVIISAAYAKVPETQAERYECVANYVKNKNLLDKYFIYTSQFGELECERVISDLRKLILDDTLNSFTGPASKEESEESSDKRKLYQDNSACIRTQLDEVGYSDLMMRLYVYENSKTISKNQKKRLSSATEAEATLKTAVGFSLCTSETVFGELFDNLMKNEDDDDSLEGKQSDYCLRKYVVDKGLINTEKFSVILNPHNIELNFNCDNQTDSVFEELQNIIIQLFEIPGQNKKHYRCMNRTVKSEKGAEYTAKMSIYTAIQLTDEQKKELRSEFVQTFKNLHKQTMKCI